ncbi:MAG: hypothetical protein ACI4N3_04865 [Alphaproteobacteria bacterium]
MKPFNLEEYLANPSKKLVTKGGKEVRILCTDRKHKDYPIVALVKNKQQKREIVITYTSNGLYNCDSINPFENDFNLFFATEKKEGYVNIYENNWTDAHIYPSKNRCTCRN